MITKRQYADAQKVIKKYHEQLLKGQYQFIYFTMNDLDPIEKWIKASDINDASRKMKIFIDKSDKSIIVVDYEVKFNDSYIDISDNEILKNYV